MLARWRVGASQCHTQDFPVDRRLQTEHASNPRRSSCLWAVLLRRAGSLPDCLSGISLCLLLLLLLTTTMMMMMMMMTMQRPLTDAALGRKGKGGMIAAQTLHQVLMTALEGM